MTRTTHDHTAAPKLLVGILGIALGALAVWHCCVVAELQNDLGSALVERDAARGHRDMLLAEESRRMTMHLRASEN